MFEAFSIIKKQNYRLKQGGTENGTFEFYFISCNKVFFTGIARKNEYHSKTVSLKECCLIDVGVG